MSTNIPRVAALRLVDGIPFIVVVGELDIANRKVLEDAIRAAAEQDAGAVIVSLEQATYFDSTIIHVIIRERARMRTNRQSLVVIGPAFAAGRRVLEIAGLLDPKSCFATTDAALGAAKAIQNHRAV